MTWAIVIVSSVESLSSSLLVTADDEDIPSVFFTGIWSYICMPFLIAEGFFFSLSNRSISSSSSDPEADGGTFFSFVPEEKWSTDVDTSVPRSSKEWIEALSMEDEEEDEEGREEM